MWFRGDRFASKAVLYIVFGSSLLNKWNQQLRPSFEGIGVATATEVLSTGAEMLVSKEKASQLLIRDPEHFAITLKGLTM